VRYEVRSIKITQADGDRSLMLIENWPRREAAPARHGRTAIVLWLAFILACGIIISRSQFTTDLSAFLPRSPTPAQQLLLDQIREGLASRLILVGIEGADASTRARLSKQIAKRVRADPAFVTVNNGEPVSAERDRAFLFNNRYLLSPAVTPARFSADGLHAALSDTSTSRRPGYRSSRCCCAT
jgi:predicted exporter